MLDLMRKIYLLSTLVLAILFGNNLNAQDFSNKGKEFWLAYCYHVGMVNTGSAPAMTLYITSDVATTYTVEIFGVTTLSSGPIAANQVIPVTIPNTYFINGNGVFNNRTIRVTAAKPVVVYSFITRAQASAASLCLPTNVLGKEYYASSFTQLSNENNSSSYITIIAVEDNTNVEITPTATTTAGWLANSINTVTLNKGQIYQVLGITTGNTGVDLSGTKVRTIASTSGGCKKIAVFSGSGKISIGSPSCTGGSADNLYQQLYPVASWGRKFLTAPSSGRPFNHYRVMRSNPLTNVYVNGVLIPAASFTNNYYQFYNNTPNLITADIPITVAQYFTSQNCPINQNPYDPDMIVLNPVEQNINKVTLVSSPLTTTGAHQHHLHVVMKNASTGGTSQSSFRFDGAAVPLSSWVVHPQDATFSYLYLSNIAAGNHNLTSDSGFNAVAYGYGNAETYGYSAGANVKDLYQQIGVSSQFGIEPAPSVCKGSPFRFKVSLPYCADSMRWNISSLPGSPAQPPTQIYTTCTAGPGGPDSTTVVNGKILYWYSLPTLYTFNTSGAFPVEIEVYAPNSDGCGNLQEIPFDLNIFDPPSADFTFLNSGCAAEPIQFTDNTTTPRPSYIWTWNFNDPASGASNTSTSQNPSHTFSGPGTYNVTFSTVTTPGCFSAQIIKPVIIAPIPTATITGTNTVCLGDTPPFITFTVSGGTAPYTFTYNINGGASQTISTTGTNTSVTIPVPTGVNGTFRYNLEQVKNTGSTLCVTNYTNTSAVVTVNQTTALTLSSGSNIQSVCENVAIGTTVYSISGGGNNATVTGLPPGVIGVYNAGTFTLSGAPTSIGTFNYTVTATGLCLPTSLTGTITVNPDAIINLTAGSDNQTVCINTAIATIGYTISGGGTGATVTPLPAGLSGTYNGGIFTITGAPTVTGTFNYSVTTTGTCLQKVATGSITVNPDAVLTLSSAAGTTAQAVCINTALTAISYAVSGGGTGAASTGLPAGVTGTFNSGIFTITGTPSIAGLYNYAVTTSGICVQPTLTGTINVTPDAAIALTSAAGSNNQEFCVSSAISPITYSITGGGTNGSVSGLPAGITGTYSGGVITISGTSTVSGTFIYTVTTTGTCIQKTATGTLIINALPTADFSLSSPTCETKLLNYTDLSVPNSGVLTNWSWNFGDAGTSTSQNPTHTYINSGTYTVSLSVTTNKGCTNIPVFTRQVTINPQPVTGFILPEVCLSDTYAQFTDTTRISSGSIASWLWNFGDPGSGPLNTSVLQNPQHSYTAVGIYTATLTTTSNSGCVTTLAQSFTVNGDIPVSNFNALNPATMCANDSISIQDASTVNFGSVTKIEIYWDNIGAPGVFQTDDFPTTGKIYRHLYPNFQAPLTRTYTIRYRAYSGATCINDRIKTVVVNAAPKVQFNNIPNACFDATPFQITQASEIGAVPGVGVFSGPGVTAAGIFNPALVGPGTYTIKYTFTSTAGGCVDTLSRSITVYDTARANFTFSALACEKTAIAFNSTNSTIPAASGSITGWGWDFGDPASGAANISTLQNPSHLFSSWGTYNVRLFVTTSNGCRSTIRTLPVYVNPIPRPNFTFPASACLPSANVSFNNISSIPDGTQSSFSYLWNFGDPASGMLNTSTGSSPSHIYNTVGPFNINLRVTSGAGCVHDTTILLNTIHPEPTGAFNIDKNDICVGQSFLFTDNSNPADGTTVQWNWNMGDGNVRTTSSFNYIYGTAGTFDITMFITNSHGCRSTSATRRVTVNPYPSVNAGPDLFILEDGSDTLEPIITATNPTYLWTPNNYFLSSNTIKNPVVKGVNDITYTLTVTGQGNCVSSDQVFIKVLKGPEIPNIFSPNGDGIHDTWIIKYLDTYPGGTVEVFNRYGQLIFRSVNYSVPWDGTINGKQVPMGTYYYIVDPKNGRKLMSGYVDIIR